MVFFIKYEYYTISGYLTRLTHPIAKKLWFMTLFDFYAIS